MKIDSMRCDQRFIFVFAMTLLFLAASAPVRAHQAAAGPSAPAGFLGMVVPEGYRLDWIDSSRTGDHYVLERRQQDETVFSPIARLAAHTVTYVDPGYSPDHAPVYRLRMERDSKIGDPAFCDSRVKAWTYIRIIAYDAMWSTPPTMNDVMAHLQAMSGNRQDLPNLNSVLLGDAYGNEGSIYGAVGTNGSPVVFQRPEPNMGSVQTYKEFFDWVVKNYPGQRYAISFWGHGSGVIGFPDSVKRPESVGLDTTNDDELTPEEMGEAFRYLTKISGRKVDIFFACACLAQMVEDAYAIRDSVNYMVAGESVVGCGCDVFDVLRSNMEKPAAWIANHTTSCQPTTNYKKDVVYSAVDVRQVGDTAVLADDLAQALLGYVSSNPANAARLKTIAGQTQNMNFIGTPDVTSAYLDVKDFCVRLRGLGNPAITSKANALLTQVEDKLVGNVVIQNDDKGLYAHAHGISIFHVCPDYPEVPSEYDKLSFAQATHWAAYLELLATK